MLLAFEPHHVLASARLEPDLLAALLLASPFILYVPAVEGRWTLSGKDRWQYMLGVHQYRSGDQPFDPASAAELRGEIGSPLAHAVAQPREFLLGYGYRALILTRNLARQTGHGLLIPFMIVGWVAARKKSETDLWALLVPLSTLPVLPLVGTFFRHSLVPGAVFLALGAIGLSRIVAAGADRFPP